MIAINTHLSTVIRGLTRIFGKVIHRITVTFLDLPCVHGLFNYLFNKKPNKLIREKNDYFFN